MRVSRYDCPRRGCMDRSSGYNTGFLHELCAVGQQVIDGAEEKERTVSFHNSQVSLHTGDTYLC